AIMKQVENAQSECLSSRWIDEDHGFDVPQAENKNEIPSRGQLWADIQSMDAPEHLDRGRSFQPRSITHVRVECAQGVAGTMPTQSEVSNGKRQDDNTGALIKQSGKGMIKDCDQRNPDYNPRGEKRHPKEGAHQSDPG